MKRTLDLYDEDCESDEEFLLELRRQSTETNICLSIAGSAMLKIISNVKASRRTNPYLKRRQDWDFHINNLMFEGQFKHYFRMSLRSFEKLSLMLGPLLLTNAKRSIARTGVRPLNPDEMLQATISWLAGGSFHHIRTIAGISKPHFFQVIHRVMAVINYDTSRGKSGLDIEFPSDQEAFYKMACGFRAKSTNNVISGCAVAVSMDC